jgi:hypothetical protein
LTFNPIYIGKLKDKILSILNAIAGIRKSLLPVVSKSNTTASSPLRVLLEGMVSMSTSFDS